MTTPPPLPDVPYMTVREVAALLRVSKMTVYRLTEDDTLPSVRIGRSVRIPTDAVRGYLDRGQP